jgi:MoxR-like ATPase
MERKDPAGILSASVQSEADVGDLRHKFGVLVAEMHRVIIGYRAQLACVFRCMLMGGHIFEVGPPGVAKTYKLKCLAILLGARFNRIQFTPDTDASSLVGFKAPVNGEWKYQPGDLTRGAQIVLADEINRGSPFTQAAMLECMAEGQVTVEGHTELMPDFFWVTGTQNPIESDGVNPVPHAQLDRIACLINYELPNERDLAQILKETAMDADLTNMRRVKQGVMTVEEVLAIRRYIFANVKVPEATCDYAARLVASSSPSKETNTTNEPLRLKIAKQLKFGMGPRGGQWLIRLAMAKAWMEGREVVEVEDIRAVLPDVLRARLIVSDDLDDDNVPTAESISALLIKDVPV